VRGKRAGRRRRCGGRSILEAEQGSGLLQYRHVQAFHVVRAGQVPPGGGWELRGTVVERDPARDCVLAHQCEDFILAAAVVEKRGGANRPLPQVGRQQGAQCIEAMREPPVRREHHVHGGVAAQPEFEQGQIDQRTRLTGVQDAVDVQHQHAVAGRPDQAALGAGASRAAFARESRIGRRCRPARRG